MTGADDSTRPVSPRPWRVSLPSLLGVIAFAVGCDAVIGENFDGYRPKSCATPKECGSGGRVEPGDSGSGGAGGTVVNLMTGGSSALPPGIAGSTGALDAAAPGAGARNDASVDPVAPPTVGGGSTRRDSSPECRTGDAQPCACPAGFKKLELGPCVPEDDCALTNACDERAICKSEAFAYSCRCPAYYRDDAHGLRCEDRHYQWHITMANGAANFQLNPSGSDLLLPGMFRGDNSLQGLQVSAGTDYDVFVAKLDEQGALVQYRQFGGTGDDTMFWSATDSHGDLLVTGYTDGGIDLGSGPIDTGGRRARYVAKLRATDLAPVWGRVFYNVDIVPKDPQTVDPIWDGYVSTDASDNVLFAGRFQDELTADSFILKSGGGWDMFLAKLSPAGDLLWVKGWGGPGDDYFRAAVADVEDNVFASGTFEQQVTIGNTSLTSLGGRDAVLVKLTPEGSPLWSRQLGGSGADYCGRMSIDHDGNPIVVGDFTGQAGFGSGSMFVSNGGWDAFITKWDTNGRFMWSRQIGGAGEDVLWDVAVSPANEIVVVGSYASPVDFGEGKRTPDGTDAFVAKYTAFGGFIWSQGFGSPGVDAAGVVRIAPTGIMYVGGGYAGPIDFGGGLAGGNGLYFVRLTP